ncbi:glycerol-3-phosphate dehydrogenase/oxidase [Deferrisoma sp.]
MSPASYDVAVVGGGIVGAAAARDAALRGLRVLLLERGDWASGTTGIAAGLVHSGFRFARDRKFHLALQCLREWETLHRSAPHLVRPMAVLIPVYRGGGLSLRRIRWGFRFYEWLSLGSGGPPRQILSAREAVRRAPALSEEGLLGAGLFYDFRCLFPSRLVLEHVRSAQEEGADCHNYHEVTRLRRVAEGFEIEARDRESGAARTFRARTVINAAGPWIDEVGQRLTPDWPGRVRLLRGTQVWVDADLDVALWHEGYPPCFGIPRGDHVLVGWDLAEISAPSNGLAPRPGELAGWLTEARRRIPGLFPHPSRLLLAETGAWAVPRRDGTRAGDLPCEYEAVEEGGMGGHITLAGGNLTLFRRLAEDGVDAVCRRLGVNRPGTTDRTPLAGGGFRDQVVFRENLVECTENLPRIPRAVVDHLVGLYGRKACEVLELGLSSEDLRERLGPDAKDHKAQVVYAVRAEHARHLDDVLLRRLSTGLRPDRGLGVAEAVAQVMARELGWDEPRRQEELDRFRAQIRAQMEAAREAFR